MGAGPVVAPQGLMRMAPQGVALPHLAHQGQSLRSRKRQVGPAAQAGQQPGGARVALGLARVLKTGPGLAGSHTLASRATDTAGNVQPEQRMENAGGYNNTSWADHAVKVTVA